MELDPRFSLRGFWRVEHEARHVACGLALLQGLHQESVPVCRDRGCGQVCWHQSPSQAGLPGRNWDLQDLREMLVRDQPQRSPWVRVVVANEPRTSRIVRFTAEGNRVPL